MNKKTLWITETAVMIALLVALQWATKPLGQFVTGSCVNLVLGVSVLVGGLWCGLTVALVSPFFAFLLGIGPAFLPIVPMVAVGNMVLVVILHLLASRDKIAIRSYLAVAVGAVTKFLALWLLIVKLVLPTLGLAEKQVAAISASFSWPQLVTAAIGGVLAPIGIYLVFNATRAGRDHRPPDPQGPALQVRTYQPSFNGKQPAGVTGRLFFACQGRRLKDP